MSFHKISGPVMIDMWSDRMMSKFDLNGTKKRKTIYFGLFIVAALSASVMLSAMAAEGGMYWIGMDFPKYLQKLSITEGS